MWYKKQSVMPMQTAKVVSIAELKLLSDLSNDSTADIQNVHVQRVSFNFLRDHLFSKRFVTKDYAITICKSVIDCGEVSTKLPSDDSYEVSGSPLKLQQFDISRCTDSSTGRTIVPLSSSEARIILADFSKAMLDSKDIDILPLFTYVNGDDPERLAFLGLDILDSNSDGIKKCVSYKIKTRGPIPYALRDNLPKVFALANKDFPHNTTVETKYTAEYDVTQSGIQLKCDSSHVQSSSLILKLQWTRSSSLLQTPPLDSKTEVEAVISSGDMRSVIYNMYLEISALQGFVNGLKDGLVKWSPQAVDKPILERVTELVEDVKKGSAYNRQRHDKDDSETPTITFGFLKIDERFDLDFTENLWNVLKDCSSYRDLVECFTFVINELQQGLLQPMVHKNNKCQFAKLIRSSYHGNMTSPDLQGAQPLEFLVEIGIEKLQRDYQNAFIGKDLAAASHLEYFVARDETLEERVVLLDKLHHSLELVAMLSQYFSLPRTTLGITARRTLKYYESHAIDSDHVFKVPVSTNDVYDHVERSQPRFWQLEMSSEVEGLPVCSIYLLTTKPVFSHTRTRSRSSGQVADGDDDEELLNFYLTEATQSVFSL